jgi:hypothetical protein
MRLNSARDTKLSPPIDATEQLAIEAPFLARDPAVVAAIGARTPGSSR